MSLDVRAPRQAAGGFTFIEVVVVMAILVVIAALVAPFVGRGTQGLQLRSEAARVAALLREARLEAVTHRRKTHVALDRVQNTVVLTAADREDPMRQLTMPPGIRLSVDRGGETLSFSPRGITRETRWVLEGPGGRRLAIGVEAISGRVTVRPETGS